MDEDKNIIQTGIDKVHFAETSVIQNGYDKVRENFFEFFTNRMSEIASKDALLKKISERMLEKLENDPDPTYENLQDMYRTISADSRMAVENILSLFRATAGVGSVLGETIGKKEEKVDEFDKVYDSMSSEDLQKLDKLLRLINSPDNGAQNS